MSTKELVRLIMTLLAVAVALTLARVIPDFCQVQTEGTV